MSEWDEFPEVEENVAERPAVEVSAARKTSEWDQFPEAEEDWNAFPKAEDEETSAGGAAGRSFLRNLFPSIVAAPAAVAGGGLGLALGLPSGPGAFLTGAGGAIAAGAGAAYIAHKAQDAFLEFLGLKEGTGTFSTASEQKDVEEHPYASFAGGLAPNVLGFGTGIGKGITAAGRALGGAFQGGIEAGQELYQEGKIDPIKLALATALGVATPQPRGWVQPAENVLPNLRRRLQGSTVVPHPVPTEVPVQPPPEAVSPEPPPPSASHVPPDPVASNAAGVAASKTPVQLHEETGNSVGAPMASRERTVGGEDYGKKLDAEFPQVKGNIPIDHGEIPQDIASVLKKSNAEETPVQPTEQAAEGFADFTISPDQIRDLEIRLSELYKRTPSEIIRGITGKPMTTEEFLRDQGILSPKQLQAANENGKLAVLFGGRHPEALWAKGEEVPRAEPPREEVTAPVTPEDQALLDRVSSHLARTFPDENPAVIKQKVEAAYRSDPKKFNELLDNVTRTSKAKDEEALAEEQKAKAVASEVIGERIKPEIKARRQGVLDATKRAATEHFEIYDKETPFPTKNGTPEATAAAARAKELYDRAVKYNGGNDPFGPADQGGAQFRKNVADRAEYVLVKRARDVVRKPMSMTALKEFATTELEIRKSGKTDSQIISGHEADMTNRRTDFETVSKVLPAEEPVTRDFPEYVRRRGDDPEYVQGQNILREHLNGLSERDFKMLVEEHPELRTNVEGTTDPMALLKALSEDLARLRMKERPPRLNLPPRDEGKETPVKTAAEVRQIETNSPEGKEIAARYANLGAPKTSEKAQLADIAERTAHAKRAYEQDQNIVSRFFGDESGSGPPIFNWRLPSFGGRQGPPQKGQHPPSTYDPDGVLRSETAPRAMMVRMTDQILRSLRRKDPEMHAKLEPVHEHILEADVKGRALEQEHAPLLQDVSDYRGTNPKESAELGQLMLDESRAGLFADKALNAQGYPVNKVRNAQGVAEHTDLQQRYNALPSEAKTLRDRVHKMFKDRFEKLTSLTAENRISKMLGIDDPALTQRVLDDTVTPADRARLQKMGYDDPTMDHIFEVIRETEDLAKTNGPYMPAVREGDYVVTGKVKIVNPSAGRRLSPDLYDWEFNSFPDAEKFAAAQRGKATVHTYHVDAATGERYYTAQVKQPDGTMVDKTFAYKAGDPGVAKRWKVHVEPQYLSFHRTRAEAHAAEKDVRSELSESTVEPRKYVSTDGFKMLNDATAAIENRMKNNPLYSSMTSAQKETLRLALSDHLMQMAAATHAHSSRARRRNVLGAQFDLGTAADVYNRETSQRLAGLEFQPKIDAAMAGAKELMQATAAKNPELGTVRRAALNEFESRLDDLKDGKGSITAARVSPWVHRIMSTSFMSRLATPAYTIAQTAQPPMVTGPLLAGEYGAKGWTALKQAYADLGVKSIWKAGFREQGEAFKGQSKPSSIVEDLISRTSDPGEKRMLRHMVETGRISGDAGIPIEEFRASRTPPKIDIGRKETKAHEYANTALGYADRALQYFEQVARVLPRVVEVQNRGVSALAAYRLELARNGGNEAGAIKKAAEVVDHSQFNYADVNKPALFRKTALRFPLQFKTFGMAMTENISHNLARAINPREAGDRAVGLQTLGWLALTHGAAAGLLGLPGWEFIKAALIGAKTAGLTGTDVDDLEVGLRRKLKDVMSGFGGEKFGQYSSEALAKGLPRLLGMDFSGRLGLDNMLLFGQPRSGSDSDHTNNLKAWMFDLVGGAPGGMAFQMSEGLRDMISGDYAKGLSKAVPLKIASDTLRAYEYTVNGRKDKRGRESMPPYSPVEAAMRVTGITPAREAEYSRFRNAEYSGQREERDAKSKLIAAWLRAAPEDKGKRWMAAVQAGISPASLAASLKRHQGERRVEGIPVTKAREGKARELSKVYNLRIE